MLEDASADISRRQGSPHSRERHRFTHIGASCFLRDDSVRTASQFPSSDSTTESQALIVSYESLYFNTTEPSSMTSNACYLVCADEDSRKLAVHYSPIRVQGAPGVFFPSRTSSRQLVPEQKLLALPADALIGLFVYDGINCSCRKGIGGQRYSLSSFQCRYLFLLDKTLHRTPCMYFPTMPTSRCRTWRLHICREERHSSLKELTSQMGCQNRPVRSCQWFLKE